MQIILFYPDPLLTTGLKNTNRKEVELSWEDLGYCAPVSIIF
jgi:hypothetical protein